MTRARFLAAATATLLLALIAPAADAVRPQETTLVSRSMDGGTPNGASTNAVISGDRRFARVIAFESEASNLVPGDGNGHKDVFAVLRGGSFGNNGSPWRPGATRLISRGLGGQPANGPSFGAAVDGGLRDRPRCVAFLSAASNLVEGDTNGKVDAFLSRGPGGAPRRVSLPGGGEAGADTTAVTVSSNCSRVAFVTGGALYVRRGSRTRSIRTDGPASDPSFAAGEGNDLVFAARNGVYRSRNASRRPRLVAAGGRNPAYNGVRRRVVAYERDRGGHVQVAFRDVGRGERVASSFGGAVGNGDSRNPVVVNSGYYVGFESDATNLGTDAARNRMDVNGQADSYLYTGVRRLTLVQSVRERGVPLPGGGHRPSVSFYANYIVFHSAAPIGSPVGAPQVFMRWLGPV
jgi:hypothetical protein